MKFTLAALVSLTCSTSLVLAQGYRGFNTGALTKTEDVKSQSDFEAEFENQKKITGLNGTFTSARLFTMIQGKTTSNVISAIPAAIKTNTSLLLGLWGSAGSSSFQFELDALDSAIQTYGQDFADLVVGISVGSEDLYRSSAVGVRNDAGVGAQAADIVDYINRLRTAINGTSLSEKPVGHVDTWDTWTNTSNSAVWEACDWIGLDSYTYYFNDIDNKIENAGSLYYQSYNLSQSTTQKPIWVTETGWPVSGPTHGQAVASAQDARSFWLQVYCTLPADTPVYWYIQLDANVAEAAAFGVVGDTLQADPLYALDCDGAQAATPSLSGPTLTPASVTPTETGGPNAAHRATPFAALSFSGLFLIASPFMAGLLSFGFL